jgi:hypothetical protein
MEIESNQHKIEIMIFYKDGEIIVCPKEGVARNEKEYTKIDIDTNLKSTA